MAINNLADVYLDWAFDSLVKMLVEDLLTWTNIKSMSLSIAVIAMTIFRAFT